MPQKVIHAPKTVRSAKKSCTIYDDNSIGTVCISEDVLAIIAALAATEVEGVAHISGGITHDKAARTGARSLARGVKVEIEDNELIVRIILVVTYGCSIPQTTLKVQQNVKETIEEMTGLTVKDVHVSVSDVASEEK